MSLAGSTLTINEAGSPNTVDLSGLTPSTFWTSTNTGSIHPTTASDNIGIGTNAAGYPLEINKNQSGTSPMAAIINTNATGDAPLAFSSTTGNYIIGADGNTFKIASSSTNLALSTRMTIGSTGNVGFGTTAPTAIVHSNAVGGATAMKAVSNTGTALDVTSMSGGAAAIFWNGNVGIGNTPGHPLHVNKNFAGNYVASIENPGTQGSGLKVVTLTDASSYALNLEIDGNQFFKVRNDLMVGIGLGGSAPTNTLHLDGSLRLDNIGGTNANGNVLTTDGTGVATWEPLPVAPAALWNEPSAGEIIPVNASADVGVGDFSASSPNILGATRAFTISGTDSYTNNITAALELRGSQTSADAGVGNISFIHAGGSTEAARIESKTSSNLTYGQLAFHTFNGSLNEAMRIDENGLVGIGTTNPTEKLHVYQASSNAHAKIESASGGIATLDIDAAVNRASVDFYDNGALGGMVGYSVANDYLFLNDGAESLVSKGGNIGIGLNTPASKLHVVGSSYLNGATVIGSPVSPNGLSTSLKVYSGNGAGTAYFHDSGDNVSMSVLSSGNVVIGGSTGVGKLLVQATDVDATGASGSFINVQNKSNTTNTTAGVRFRTGGSTAVNGDFHYKGGIFFKDNASTNGEGDMIFALNNVASSANVTTADAAMTIASTGHVGIGATAPAAGLQIDDASADPALRVQKSGVTRFMVANNGFVALNYNLTPSYSLHMNTNSAAKPTSNVWTVASDARLKKDIKPFKGGLDDVLKIDPVWFTYNGKAGMPNETGVGVIAQDLQKVAPYMVNTWTHTEGSTDEKNPRIDGPKTDYLGVDNGAMTYMLINAIKEQQEMIEELKQEIQKLKNQ